MQPSLRSDLERLGNLATRVQIRRLGFSERVIRQAVDNTELWPIGRAWLAAPGADPRATRAVALGGRLTAASALASYGVWVTRPSGLWIASPRTASRLPPTGLEEHRLWVNDWFPVAAGALWRMSLPDSLLQFARVGSSDDVVAAFDSAINKKLVSAEALDAIFERLPRRQRRLKQQINGEAQSGLETLFRLAALAEGWNVEVQVSISGVGRVDILIDGWLVIEVDGAAWHDGAGAQDEDRRREAEMVLHGYGWHRFRYRQVLEQMPMCLEVVRIIRSHGRPAVSAAVRS